MGGEGVEDLSGDGHWGTVRGEVLLPRCPSNPGEVWWFYMPLRGSRLCAFVCLRCFKRVGGFVFFFGNDGIVFCVYYVVIVRDELGS